MRYQHRLFIILTTLLLALSAKADPRSGAMLANACAGCHGTSGHSAGLAMPSLAGLNSRYLYQTMLDYRSGRRQSTIMGRLAKGYTDQELKAIASFFGTQPWQQAEPATDEALIAQGKTLHDAQCESCHQQGGRKNHQDVPRLAGQWQEFLFNQMLDMSMDDFHGPQPLLMRQRMQALSAADIQALAAYYASRP